MNIAAGGAASVTVGAAEVTVTVALALFVLSATDVTMMLTLPAVNGAVYWVEIVLSGPNEPHVAAELPGEQLQVTPEFVVSPVIDAMSVAPAPMPIEVGGAVLILTEI